MTDLQKRIKVYELRLMNFEEERELLSEINSEVENLVLNTRIEDYMDFLNVLGSIKPESIVKETIEEKQVVEETIDDDDDEKFVETSDKPNSFFIHEEPKKRRGRIPTVNKIIKHEPVHEPELPKLDGRRKENKLHASGLKNVVIVNSDKGSYAIYNETGGSIESGFQNKPSAIKFAKDKGWNIVTKIVSANELKR